jgi:hypothetical protein
MQILKMQLHEGEISYRKFIKCIHDDCASIENILDLNRKLAV